MTKTKLLQRNRLRTADGRKLSSKDDYLDIIKKALDSRPQNTAELASILALSTKQTKRYIAMLGDSIQKIEGSHRYKIANKQYDKKLLLKTPESVKAVKECHTIKRWIEKNTSKHNLHFIHAFANICLGRIAETFKINPDNWIHPYTTEQCIRAIGKKHGYDAKRQIPRHYRIAIRMFLKFGYGYDIPRAESDSMGISGEKNKAGLSKLFMTDSQYSEAKTITQKEFGEKTLAKLIFRYWTFCRPSTLYTVKTRDLLFYDRVIEYVQLGDKKITNPTLVDQLRGEYKISSFTQRAGTGEVFEHKTQTAYPKYVYSQEDALFLERYVKKRKEMGYKYLFWDKNATEFIFEDYDRITRQHTKKDNKTFKDIFFKVGFEKGDFGKQDKVNYALRHFGVQKWLRMTDYDYEFVCEMGWEDLATLRTWYGKRPAHELEKKLMGIVI